MATSDKINGSQLVFTEFAIAKCIERFPGQDMHALYLTARLLTAKKSKLRSRIKARSSIDAKNWMSHGYQGRYYKCTSAGVVFVMAAPETVITVFKLES